MSSLSHFILFASVASHRCRIASHCIASYVAAQRSSPTVGCQFILIQVVQRQGDEGAGRLKPSQVCLHWVVGSSRNHC